jgi:hypothetical protein
MLRSLKFQGFLLKFLLVAAASPALSSISFATLYDEMTDTQKTALHRGEQVVITEEVGEAWPQVTIYQRIESTPEEAMAVMTDYERHRTLLKDITQSRISKRPTVSTSIVDYIYHLPWPIADENSSLKYEAGTRDHRKSYVLSWSMVRSDRAKTMNGRICFEPLGGGTLLAYQNLIVPGAYLAGLLKGQAERSARQAARDLARQIQHERANDPLLLALQVAALRQTLGN